MIISARVLTILACTALLGCGKPEGTAAGAGGGAAGADPPALQLDASGVPEDLRSLVPLASQWGIGDDVIRLAKVDRATAAEREELKSAVDPLSARITAWLDSFPVGGMSDEAAAFMYMQLALEEMTAGKR